MNKKIFSLFFCFCLWAFSSSAFSSCIFNSVCTDYRYVSGETAPQSCAAGFGSPYISAIGMFHKAPDYLSSYWTQVSQVTALTACNAYKIADNQFVSACPSGYTVDSNRNCVAPVVVDVSTCQANESVVNNQCTPLACSPEQVAINHQCQAIVDVSTCQANESVVSNQCTELGCGVGYVAQNHQCLVTDVNVCSASESIVDGVCTQLTCAVGAVAMLHQCIPVTVVEYCGAVGRDINPTTGTCPSGTDLGNGSNSGIACTTGSGCLGGFCQTGWVSDGLGGCNLNDTGTGDTGTGTGGIGNANTTCSANDGVCFPDGTCSVGGYPRPDLSCSNIVTPSLPLCSSLVCSSVNQSCLGVGDTVTFLAACPNTAPDLPQCIALQCSTVEQPCIGSLGLPTTKAVCPVGGTGDTGTGTGDTGTGSTGTGSTGTGSTGTDYTGTGSTGVTITDTKTGETMDIQVPNTGQGVSDTDLLAYINFANPFEGQGLPSWFPSLPETSCSYEIHEIIFGRNFDMSPCVKLQPLRLVLEWAFSMISIFLCFRIVFSN